MGQKVTIRGSRTTPGDRLAPGEEATVEVTTYIRNLLRGGTVELVGTVRDGAASKVLTDPAVLQAVVHGTGAPMEGVEVPLGVTAELHAEDTGGPYTTLPEMPAGAYGPDSTPLDPVQPTPPRENESRSKWADFLDNYEPTPITYPAGAKRDQLIAAYKARIATPETDG